MMMRLFNSLSGKKEIFSAPKREVKMYVCGITPYDTTHLGHAFTYTFFDVLARYLKFKRYQVTYVQNITDVDDDILKRAKETKKDWRKLGVKWTKRYFEDMRAINNQAVDVWCRATDYIEEMVVITKDLLDKGVAYESGGSVYFSVEKFTDLGKLSKLSPKKLLPLANDRGNFPDDPNKKDPLDFVLWQKRKRREPSWDSPWGKGRPGWHIECSAMALNNLGKTIDIHGGGKDLEFPHHEFEIAQSEAHTHQQFVRFWIHVAMVRYRGKKMSKSLGNLVMIADLLKKYSVQAIRILLLSHHYRRTWEYTEAEIQKAQERADLLDQVWVERSQGKNAAKILDAKKSFFAALEDDINTPKALEILVKLAKKSLSNQGKSLTTLRKFFKEAYRILGLPLSK
jgi:cysteinyl-tRNA synthetase